MTTMTLKEIREQLRKANLNEVARICDIHVRTLYRISASNDAGVLQETFDKLHPWAVKFAAYERIPKQLRRQKVGAPKGTVKRSG